MKILSIDDKSECGAARREGICQDPAAFSRLELLVVLAVLAMLVLLVIPGQARAKPGGHALQCLNNLRQLMNASSMYCADNRDTLPMVFHGGFVPSAGDPAKPWATGWLDWSVSPDNTNTTYLLETRYASLAQYCARDHRIYRCPADIYASSAQLARGWDGRVRSVSANLYVGKGNAWASGTGWSPSGPNNLSIYKGAAKAADLLIPGPARTWVYIDEHPDSMNDSGLFAPNTAANIPDAPANYHEGAAGVAMADGSCQIHRWTGIPLNKPRSRGGLMGVIFSAANNFAAPAGDPDLFWLSYGSPRWTTRTVAD